MPERLEGIGYLGRVDTVATVLSVAEKLGLNPNWPPWTLAKALNEKLTSVKGLKKKPTPSVDSIFYWIMDRQSPQVNRFESFLARASKATGLPVEELLVRAKTEEDGIILEARESVCAESLNAVMQEVDKLSDTFRKMALEVLDDDSQGEIHVRLRFVKKD